LAETRTAFKAKAFLTFILGPFPKLILQDNLRPAIRQMAGSLIHGRLSAKSDQLGASTGPPVSSVRRSPDEPFPTNAQGGFSSPRTDF
jgi:hypothetical protein